jgi:hypothetical protein
MKPNIEKILSSPATWYVAGAVLLVVLLKRWNILPEGKTAQQRADEKALEKAAAEIKNSGEIWSTHFWENYPAKQYTAQQAKNLSDIIRNSFGFFNDDEARIQGVFRQIKYQTNVSQISDAYTRDTGRDLHSDLIDKLSASEMKDIYAIIASKPL